MNAVVISAWCRRKRRGKTQLARAVAEAAGELGSGLPGCPFDADNLYLCAGRGVLHRQAGANRVGEIAMNGMNIAVDLHGKLLDALFRHDLISPAERGSTCNAEFGMNVGGRMFSLGSGLVLQPHRNRSNALLFQWARVPQPSGREGDAFATFQPRLALV